MAETNGGRRVAVVEVKPRCDRLVGSVAGEDVVPERQREKAALGGAREERLQRGG